TLNQSGQTVCFYSTKVRISVRAGEALTVREGLGTGLGRSPLPEVAHEIAIKSAETDATKRALATFGNAFGLALYDRRQSQVTRPRPPGSRSRPELVVTSLDGKETLFSDPEAFTSEVLRQADELTSIDELYAFWASNAEALKTLNRDFHDSDRTERIINTLKDRARQIARETPPGKEVSDRLSAISNDPITSSYLLPKAKRIRDRAHLAFVATQPCLICGRQPTQAHHLRFAQRHGLGHKVSDEFTVPLCVTHHDQLHRHGDEQAFWTSHGVPQPLQHAAKLWKLSHHPGETKGVDFDPETEQEFNEPSLRKHFRQTDKQ
ncbi:MAG TPA: Rad52/Rad22 family DNA repair protein, partial [Afipia sp.]